MPILENFRPTLLDHAKRLDPDGSIATIVELMNEVNPVMEEAVFFEGNLPTGNRTTQRISIPTPQKRRINEGTAPTKSETKQVDDTICILEDYGEIDVELAKLNGNTNEFRASENIPHIEGMTQTFAGDIFYADPKKDKLDPMGLFPRFNSLSGATKDQLVDFGGAGTKLTSVTTICWGQSTFHGIYPKGSKAGIEHKDMGEQVVTLEQNRRLRVLMDNYVWHYGFALKDHRYVARVCNVDVDDIMTDDSARDKLIDDMTIAYFKIHNINMGKAGIYVNRSIATYLTIAARRGKNILLSIDDIENRGPVTKFMGLPIRVCDKLRNNEEKVV